MERVTKSGFSASSVAKQGRNITLPPFHTQEIKSTGEKPKEEGGRKSQRRLIRPYDNVVDIVRGEKGRHPAR